MSALILYVFLFLVLSTPWVRGDNTTISSDLSISFPVCGNCEELVNIHIGSGGICHYEDGLSLVRIFESENNSKPECIPRIYDLSRAIRHFCCFWSPELGCSMLIGPLYYERFELKCDQCVPVCTRFLSIVNSSAQVLINIPLLILALSLISIR